MTRLKRYLAGECGAVWAELRADPSLSADALAVVDATIDRVALNARRLVERLEREGYEFEGTPLLPTCRNTSLLERIERMGTVPYTLRSFWAGVGGIDLRGTNPAWGFTGWAGRGNGRPVETDPLCVDGLSTGWVKSVEGDYEDWLEAREEAEGQQFVLPLSPDNQTKSNISGAGPDGIALPADPLEGVWIADPFDPTPFVNHLREAFRWAGFPGLRSSPELLPADWLRAVRSELIPF